MRLIAVAPTFWARTDDLRVEELGGNSRAPSSLLRVTHWALSHPQEHIHTYVLAMQRWTRAHAQPRESCPVLPPALPTSTA